jgi:hypothetical protein
MIFISMPVDVDVIKVYSYYISHMYLPVLLHLDKIQPYTFIIYIEYYVVMIYTMENPK